jgi:hypothetical protein
MSNVAKQLLFLTNIAPEEYILTSLRSVIDEYLANKNNDNKTALIVKLQMANIKMMDITIDNVNRADKAREALEFFEEIEKLKKP